jgi:cholesterol oxidase
MAATGISFRETMRGWFALGGCDPRAGAARGAAAGTELTMNAAIEIERLDKFVNDPTHTGRLTGSINFPPLGLGMAAERGVFRLFSPTDDPKARHMVYELGFAQGGQDYYLAGHKKVRDDPGIDLWSDTTTLFTTLHKGRDAQAPVSGAGILRLGVKELMDLLSTLRVTNAANAAETAAAYAGFGRFFLGELWSIYGKGLGGSG